MLSIARRYRTVRFVRIMVDFFTKIRARFDPMTVRRREGVREASRTDVIGARSLVGAEECDENDSDAFRTLARCILRAAPRGDTRRVRRLHVALPPPPLDDAPRRAAVPLRVFNSSSRLRESHSFGNRPIGWPVRIAMRDASFELYTAFIPFNLAIFY